MFSNVSELEMFSRLPKTSPDKRIFYEAHPLKFGDLRLPEGELSDGVGHPLVILIHGGQWESSFDHSYMACMAEALTEQGIATWNIEFLRINNPGGGYPGTFVDTGRAVDFARQLAADYPINLERVVLIGHSSGGHLATWAAGRANLPSTSELASENPLRVAGVVDLAGVLDLEFAYLSGRKDILNLLGAAGDAELIEKSQEASSFNLLPLGAPQTLIIGTEDNPWRLESHDRYVEKARANAEEVELVHLEGVDHFGIMDLQGSVWEPLLAAVRQYTNHAA